MDEFCGDPKFVITPRSCRLPEELLIASMSQRNFPNPAELQWSQRSAKAPLEPRELDNSLSRSSPRERRVLLQLASPQSPNGPVQDESNTVTRAFPKQWGSPPSKLSPVKTRLPEGYGVGSATLRSWMIHRLHGAPAAPLAAGIYDASSDGTAMVTQQDDAAAAGISAWRRSALRHPDVPWAPDGGSWSDFKVKTELDSQRRRLERETHVKSASCSALSGPLVPPVVPPLLLEPLRELVDARHERNGRAATPPSTRLLLHQLHMRRSAPIDQEPHGERASGADDVEGASVDEGVRCSVDAQRPTLAVLARETHASALTQRLMRLSSLRKRFQELCTMNACEKEKAAAIIKQRAKVVRELRRQNQTRFQNQAHAYVQATQRVNHVQKTFSPQPGPPALLAPRAEEVRLLPLAHSQQLKHPASHKQWRPRAPPAMASRQRSWITAAVAATAASLFLQFFHSGTKRRAEALKQQRAAIVIQKLFRLKLVPYYVRQLASAVVTLKPWMTSALLRWRRRRLNRSADILRHTLISSMQSNKIFLSIRAFRRKVVLLQRNIRSFLSCTHARVVRLLKLLHIQCIGGHQAVLRVSARAKLYPCHAKDRAVWRGKARIFTFEDRSGDRLIYTIGSRRYISRYPAPSCLHAWAQFAVELPHSRSLLREAMRAATGGSVELDEAGGSHLMMFLSLLHSCVENHRRNYLSRVVNWERLVQENKRVSESYENFRCSRSCHKEMFEKIALRAFRKFLPSHLTPKRIHRLLGRSNNQVANVRALYH